MTKGTLLPLYNSVPPNLNNTPPLPPPPPHSYHQQKRNSLAKVGDHFLRTKKFRILSVTLGIFLGSIWILTNFSGTIDHRRLIKGGETRDGAALAAAIVLGENGEEGIHGLEVENHYYYHHHNYFYDSGDDKYDFIYNDDNEDSTNEANELKEEITIIDIAVENGNEGEKEKGGGKKNNGNFNDKPDRSSNSKDNNDSNQGYGEFRTVEYEIVRLIRDHSVVVFSKTYCP